MSNAIYDWKAQSYLKKLITTKLDLRQQWQVRSILHCNETVIPNGDMHVDLVLSNKRASFVGQVTCKNPFACPCCSARVMSKYSGEIASALDAMKKKGYHALMLTLTIPHLRFQRCREVTDILYQTWRLAFANCFNKQRKTADGKSNRTQGTFNQWCIVGNLKHYVRAMEYTWGENGWHPHFHCLFFVPAAHWDACTTLKFEHELNQAWIKYFQRAAMRYWQKNNLYTDDDNRNKIMARFLQFTKGDHALKISRDKDGTARKMVSSDYIAGFGADKELAGESKAKCAHHNGHYTPYQILDKAMNGESGFDELYLEFLLQVTTKPVHHRVNFSKTGIKKILQDWRNSEGYKEVLKKKEEEKAAKTVRLVSFAPPAWSQLCRLNYEKPVFSHLLWLAENEPDLLPIYIKSNLRVKCTLYGDLLAKTMSKNLFVASIAG